MKKLLLIFCLSFLSVFESNAQIGCAVGNTLYTTKQGSKYKTAPNQTISPSCYVVPFGGSCTVQPSTTGILVSSIQCPIDKSYMFFSMCFLVSIIGFKKIKLLNT